jgi:acyl dehydratase
MSGLYLDDLTPGMSFTNGPVSVTAEEIKQFAARFDPQPFHLDEQAAAESFFRGLAASGWHTASLTMRLMVTGGLPLAAGYVGAGGEVTWTQPVYAGDALTVRVEVMEVIASRSRPDRGFALLRCETRNQRDEVVQVLTARVMVPRRGDSPSVQ